MPILARLEPQALEKGSPSNDWTWILQAEKGKALLRLGKTLEARTLLHQAIKQMEGLGTSTWTLNNYRRALDKAQ